MLSVQNLTKRFGNLAAVSNASFEVPEGTTTLLLGPNGAGKTTIIKCIVGLLKYEGFISVDGMDASKDGPAVRSRIGYVPQQSAYYEDLSAEDQASFVAKLKGSTTEEVERKLKQVDLWQHRHLRIREFSSGMRQRLGIALALLKDPRFLIFDEPTSNVDLRGQLEFRVMLSELAKANKTILITTHLSGLDEYADRAIVMSNGRIVANGAPLDLLSGLGVSDVVYVRTKLEDGDKAVSVLQGMGVHTPTKRDEWIEFSVPPERKIEAIELLVSSGILVKDLIIEPTKIESEYIRLLNEGNRN